LRTEAAIRHKLKQAAYRHLQRELKHTLRRRPHTCIHNFLLGVQPGVEVGICTTGNFKNRICDAKVGDYGGMDGVAWAKICPSWTPFHEKEQIKIAIKDRIAELLVAEDRGPLAEKYPDLAVLAWILDAPGKETSKEEADDPIGWLWEGEGEEDVP